MRWKRRANTIQSAFGLISLAAAGAALAAPAAPENPGTGQQGVEEQRSDENAQDSAAPGMPPLKVMFRQAADLLAEANRSPELTGSGPYPAKMLVDLAYPDATIYRPADLKAMGGKKLGLLLWGNGACANDGASARAHLAQIASHGYLVIAPGKPLSSSIVSTNGPLPAPSIAFMSTTVEDLRHLLDWALAENERPGSPYAGKIDTNAIAAAGHSCGGMQAIMLGDDPRVRTVIVHNSGVNRVIPDNPPLIMDMERLRGLHRSVLFIVGGPRDVLWEEANASFDYVQGIPAALVTSDVGHGGTFNQEHGGEAARIALDWLEWQLGRNPQAASSFEGDKCRICGMSGWEIRKKRIR